MAERQLVFVQQPTRVRIPNAIWPPVRLEVRIGDRVDPMVIDGEVKLSILSGPPGGQIIGTSTARCPNGVATFDDLRFSVPGTYTLLAECDENKLELAGLANHSSIMFLDMATFDEQNRLVCPRTGIVLTMYSPSQEPPIRIDSPFGEGFALRFISGITSRLYGTDTQKTVVQALANGAVIHALYRQYIPDSPRPLGRVFAVLGGAGWDARIDAGFASNNPQQAFQYGRGGTYTRRNNNLENWSLLSVGALALGAPNRVARCYINGVQNGADFHAGAGFDGRGIHVGYDFTGDVAQVGIEPVSSLEDMDAKVLDAAKKCKVAPWVS